MDRARSHALALFALLLALFEGPAQIACAAALLITAASGGLRGVRWNIADVALLVWLLAGLAGGVASGAPKWGSEPNLRPLLVLAYLLGRTAIAGADDRTLVRMGLAFGLGATVNAAYGVVQVLIADPGLERWIVGRARAAHLATGDGRLRMATGLFYNRLKLVHVGVVALAGLGIMLWSAVRARLDRRRIAALAAAIAVLGLGLLLTYRRAAPAALVVGFLALALAMGRVRLAAVMVAAGTAMIALWSVAGYGRERLDSAGLDLDQRLDIWWAARRLIADHPLFGVGHGGYGRAIAPYLEGAGSPEMLRNALNSPHNALLYVLAETGLVGMLAFIVAVGASLAAIVVAVRAERSRHDPRAGRSRLALVGLATLMAIGVLHAVLYHAPVAMVFWALLGVASARLSELTEPEPA